MWEKFIWHFREQTWIYITAGITSIFALLIIFAPEKPKYPEYCVNGWEVAYIKKSIIYKRDENFDPIRCKIGN